MSGSKSCCIWGCLNTHGKNPSLSFFRLPTDITRSTTTCNGRVVTSMETGLDIVTLGGRENLKYVISMDNIDFGMLPLLRYQTRSETVPLWSSGSSGPGAEYFEFEVLADDGGDDAGRENARVQRCCVCDSDVPLSYWTEHTRSAGHRACLGIANVGLERTRKQMALDTPIKSNSHSSTYYCPQCSCAVDLTKRGEHEKMQEHRKSVLHIKLLQSLATLYENKNSLDDVCKVIYKEIVNKDVTENQIDTEVNNEDLELKSNTKDTNEFEKDHVIIMTTSKNKLKVSFDNYQGLCTLRGHTQCRVCRTLVDDKTQHMLDEEHRKKVETVFRDIHCIRRLDHLYNHCVLCNEVIESPESHILCSPQHKAFLQKALIEEHKVVESPQNSRYIKNVMEENFINDNESDEHNYFCKVCQVYFIKATLLQHISNDAHRNSMKISNKKIDKKEIDSHMEHCSVCDLDTTKEEEAQNVHIATKDHQYNLWLTNKDRKIHHHMKMCKQECVCQLCDVQLNNNSDEIKEHINSSKHQSNHEVLLKDNYMEKINDIKVFCSVCDKTEYMIYEIRHVNSKSHKINVSRCIDLEIGPIELRLIKNDPSYGNAKYKEILKINLIENYVLRYRCKACVKLLNKNEVFYHVFSRKHKRRLKDNTAFIKEETVARKVEFQDTSDCEVDETETVDSKQPVVKNEANIEDKEKIYEMELKLALQTNRIEDIDNEFYRCNVCDRLVTKSSNIRFHISTKEHNQKLKQVAKTQNINPIAISADLETNKYNEATTTARSTRHYESAEDVARKLENNWIERKQRKNTHRYYCRACEAAIEKGFEETHILLERHQHNMTKIKRLSANFVLKNGSIYYCTLCSESIKRGLEEIHVLSEAHKMRYNKNEQMNLNSLWKISRNYFCSICFETIQSGHEKEHIESEPHQEKSIHRNDFNTDTINMPTADLNTKIKNEELNGANSRTVEIQTHELTKPKKKLHYLFEANPVDQSQVACLVCKINLTIDKVMLHRKDINHKAIYKNLMDSNTMFRIRHRCFCECCREIFKVNCEYIHLTSDHHRLNLARNTERMDRKSVQELSLNMFYEDIAAEKKAKNCKKYAGTSKTNLTDNDSDDCGDYRFENLKRCFFVNSCVDLRNKDEEDNSVSDSNDSFLSARTNLTIEEIRDLIPEGKHVEDNVSEDPQHSDEEVETVAEFTKSWTYLFEETNSPVNLLCKLCHCVVPSRSDFILEHIDGVKHTKTYKSILLMNELKETIDKQKDTILKYRCQACGIDVDLFELFIHINSNKHKLYLTAKPSTSGHFQQIGNGAGEEVELKEIRQMAGEIDKNNTTKLIVTSEDPHVRYLMKNNNKEFYCKLCDSEIPVTDLHKHVDSKTHQMNFEYLLLEKEVKRVGVTFFCSLCKIGLVEGTELEHVYGSIHNDNLTNSSLSTSKTDKPFKPLKSNKNNGHVCTACNIEILNIPKIIKIHNDSIIHKTNLAKAKKRPQIGIDNFSKNKLSSVDSISDLLGKEPTSNEQSEYFCEVCKVKVPNNPNNIKMHNDGGRHKSNLTKLTESKSTVTPSLPATNSSAKLVSSLTVPTSSNIAKPAVWNYVENGFCHVCKTDVENNIESIRKHLEGTPHNEILKSLQSQLNEKKLSQKRQIQTNKSINTETEIKNKVSNTKTTDTSISSNLLGSENFIINVEDGYCYACKTKIPNKLSCFEDHMKGKKHTQNVKIFQSNASANEEVLTKCNQNLTSRNIMDKEKIIKSQNNDTEMKNANSNLTLNNIINYVINGYCEACKIKVPSNPHNIQEHIKGTKHKHNIELLAKMTPPPTKLKTNGVSVYQICNLNVTNNPNSILEHLNSKKHKMEVGNLKTGDKNNTNLPDVIENKSDRKDKERDLSKVNVGAKSLQGDTDDIQSIFSIISQLYNTGANAIDSRIVDIGKVNGIEVNVKSNTGNNVFDVAVAGTGAVDNSFTINSDTNSVSPNCNNTIPSIKSNTDSANVYGQIKIFKSTDTRRDDTIGTDISITEISTLKGNSTLVKTNISGTNKTEESNTEINIARTSKADDANNDSIGVMTIANPNAAIYDCDDSNAETEVNQGFYVCTVCERTVANNQTEVMSHLSSYHHLTKLSEKKLNEEEGLLPNFDSHYCDICKEKMPNNCIAIKYHNGTEKHKNRFGKMLSDNKIKIRDDKVCYCEACDLYFSKFTVKTHIDREKHKSMLQ